MIKKSKKMCVGCRDDYYNHSQPDGCWMFPDARIVERMKVGTFQTPPYKWKPRQTLNCYSPEGSCGGVMISEDDPRIE